MQAQTEERLPPFVPKLRSDRVSPARPGKSIQFYCPPEILTAFDRWWTEVGIETRTDALVWLIYDAIVTDRRPPNAGGSK